MKRLSVVLLLLIACDKNQPAPAAGPTPAAPVPATPVAAPATPRDTPASPPDAPATPPAGQVDLAERVRAAAADVAAAEALRHPDGTLEIVHEDDISGEARTAVDGVIRRSRLLCSAEDVRYALASAGDIGTVMCDAGECLIPGLAAELTPSHTLVFADGKLREIVTVSDVEQSDAYLAKARAYVAAQRNALGAKTCPQPE